MKQRALLDKYPDPAQFILDYNPDLQFKIVRCNATHADLALNLEIPSLGLLASTYGDETPLEWLKIQFGTLNDFAEVSTKIAKTQLEELAAIFLSEYYYINAAEICFFIARFKSGKYGRFYGAIDPMKITSAMLEYISERRKGIDRHEREQYRLQRQKEVEERDNNSISYVEYLEQEKNLWKAEIRMLLKELLSVLEVLILLKCNQTMRILLNILLLLGVNILFYLVVYAISDYLMDMIN